jgi:putative ABC transport system permease protein
VLIVIVTALIAVCIVFIAANTASMTVRERMREIAILKAIGFSRRRIFGMLVAEASVVPSLGAARRGVAETLREVF